MKIKRVGSILVIAAAALLTMSCIVTETLAQVADAVFLPLTETSTSTSTPTITASPTRSPTRTRTRVPTRTATASPKDNMIFSDDFSDPESGWEVWYDLGDSADYVDGTYQIYLNSTDSYVWGLLDLNFSNSSVEVDALKLQGTDENHFGIICRYLDYDNFYSARVSTSGYYMITKYVDNHFTVLNESGDWQETGTVNQGSRSNHLRFDCVGETLSLYINGHLVDSVTDNDLSGGQVGLMAGSFGSNGILFAFDDVIISMPDVDSYIVPEADGEDFGPIT